MRIHIKSRQGLYTVENYGRNSITLSTKHETFSVPTSDFKCFEGNVFRDNEEQKRIFLSVINPDSLKLSLMLEANMKAKLNLAQMQEEADQELETNYELEDEWAQEIASIDEYQRWYLEEREKVSQLQSKMRNIATEIYTHKKDYSEFQLIEKGIKFIIREDEGQYCLNFDPYGFVSNGHSDISSIFFDNYRTVNGGWLRIMNNTVILYFKSGDYGVYDDEIAIQCAKEIFPGMKIKSFAGKDWSDDFLYEDDLPY